MERLKGQALTKEILRLLDTGMKGKEVAEQLGIHEVTVSQAKNGKRKIKQKEVKSKLDSDVTLRVRLKDMGLNPQDLTISTANYYMRITYAYWKGVKINSFPSGTTRGSLLNETGNYTLNMILDVEKNLNNKEK